MVWNLKQLLSANILFRTRLQ